VRIEFTVYGDAKPAGSKRAFAIRRGGIPTGQVAVSDANPKAKAWKQEVSAAAFKACWDAQDCPLDGPLRVSMRFFRLRPKSHYGANGLNRKGRESVAPTSKPDVLKLARGVEDAMTGIVYRDDSQIVAELLSKDWGEPARVEITIECLGSHDA